MNLPRIHLRLVAVAFASASIALCAVPAPAPALNPLGPVCKAAGFLSGLAGKACSLAQHGGRVLDAGQKLLGGHVGGAVSTVLGTGGEGAGATVATTLGLAAIVTWTAGGASFALEETAKLVGDTTSPQLGAPWFSKVYWRLAGVAVLLTVPFLFAAAIQALLRSDLTLLARAAFGYLPLAMLAVGVAAQLTALLLSATDALSGFVSAATGQAAPGFLSRSARAIGLLTLASHSPFLACFVAVLTVAGAVVLWIELMMRAAAVYVIVVMLPLAFAALVWPARRVWALRSVELLVALILSKLAIVTVLTLGGAALEQSGSMATFMTGLVLLMLGAFAPWAMMRLVPVAELASGAAGRLRLESGAAQTGGVLAHGIADAAHSWASATAARMRHDAQDSAVEASAAERQVEHLLEGGGGSAPNGQGLPEGPGEPLGPDGPPPAPRSPEGPGGAPPAPRSPEGPEAAPPAPRSPARVGGPPSSPSELLGGPVASADAPADPRRASAERLPGMEARWQADDFAWNTLQLGHGREWPPRPWPASGPDEDPGPNEDPDPAARHPRPEGGLP